MVVIGCYETRNYLTLEYGEVYEMCDPPSPKIPVENGVYLKEIHPVEQKIQPKCLNDFFPLKKPMVSFF